MDKDPRAPQALPSLAGIPRVPLRHPGRWISGALSAAVLVFLVHAFATSKIEWDYVRRFLVAPAILHGVLNTLILTVCAMALGIALGLIVALMRLSSSPVSRFVASGYIWFFRGTPIYLQLLLWFNLALVFQTVGLPGVWQIGTVTLMTPFLAALLGLGVCQGAYTAEVIRAGILSIDAGQYEAAQALGMRRTQVMRKIVLPQTLRVIMPTLGNEVISMLKTTSLAAAIDYQEVIHSASLIYYVNNRVIELLCVCAVYYLVTVTVLSYLQRKLEQRLARSLNRVNPARAGTAAPNIVEATA